MSLQGAFWPDVSESRFRKKAQAVQTAPAPTVISEGMIVLPPTTRISTARARQEVSDGRVALLGNHPLGNLPQFCRIAAASGELQA